MREKMPELKPCPFCGGEAELGVDTLSLGSARCVAFACCTECGARGQQFVVCASICANDKAIEAWNRRAEDAV